MRATIVYLTVGLFLLLGGEAPCASSLLWRNGEFSDGDPDLERLSNAFARFAETVRPAVVHVRVVPETAHTSYSRGSGFIINPEGYILTAHHVVEAAKEIEVRLPDGRRLPADILAADPRVDFAILKLDADGPFPVLSLGDSDRIRVGELVGTVGYPFGTESSLHLGTVSRRGRRENGSAAFDYVQTDTGASAGESGGPLVNMKGHVIGVVTLASEKGTLGFAVPINIVKDLIPRLLSKEQIDWGWLGVRFSELSLGLAESLGLSPVRGVLVSFVWPGQPADRAGILSNDIILAVNDVPVDRVNDVRRIINGTEAGRTAKLTVFSRRAIRDVRVELGSKPTIPDGVEG
jgi:S1-C subfamily serine protease